VAFYPAPGRAAKSLISVASFVSHVQATVFTGECTALCIMALLISLKGPAQINFTAMTRTTPSCVD
jgi:hypothetical protein